MRKISAFESLQCSCSFLPNEELFMKALMCTEQNLNTFSCNFFSRKTMCKVLRNTRKTYMFNRIGNSANNFQIFLLSYLPFVLREEKKTFSSFLWMQMKATKTENSFRKIFHWKFVVVVMLEFYLAFLFPSLPREMKVRKTEKFQFLIWISFRLATEMKCHLDEKLVGWRINLEEMNECAWKIQRKEKKKRKE